MFGSFSDKKGQTEIMEGMEVIGSDRCRIGQVRGIRESSFVVYRPRVGAMLVPFTAVQSITSESLVLRATEGEVAHMAWPLIEAFAMPASTLQGSKP